MNSESTGRQEGSKMKASERNGACRRGRKRGARRPMRDAEQSERGRRIWVAAKSVGFKPRATWRQLEQQRPELPLREPQQQQPVEQEQQHRLSPLLLHSTAGFGESCSPRRHPVRPAARRGGEKRGPPAVDTSDGRPREGCGRVVLLGRSAVGDAASCRVGVEGEREGREWEAGTLWQGRPGLAARARGALAISGTRLEAASPIAGGTPAPPAPVRRRRGRRGSQGGCRGVGAGRA